jgi:hypothetical protein
LTEAQTVQRGLRARTVAIVTALALAVGLVAAPLASGAADPASGGTFKLKLNGGFKKQLKKNKVSMKPKSFTINGGSLDPTNGTGTVNLKGKLTFKNKKTGKKAVFKSLTASATAFKGKLKGKKKTIAKLSGGTVGRSGFDSSVTGRKAKFKAAKSVNKALKLGSLKNKKMGKANQTTTFSSLTVVSGSASLLLDTSASPPFTAGAKLAGHGVDPTAGGLLPTGNATLGAGPALNFPTVESGSNIRPDGTFGQLNTAGGVKFTKTDARPASCDTNHPVGISIEINNVRIDLESKTASGDVVTPIGPIGRLNIADLFGGAFNQDAATRTVTFSGVSTNLTSTSPTLLNQVFGTSAEGCNPPALDFTGGEHVGDLSGTVVTQ